MTTTNPHTVDAIAKVFATGAEKAVKQGTPRAVVAEAMFRAAVAILIIQDGEEAAIATLRDAADRLERSADATPLAN